jgi:hypothetical protein
MACCLVLGGLASPAAAKTIIVTTLDDIADPPFDADGLCGTGTISDLPGADGLISLREAIIAANNTPGADTITFLSGGTLVVNFDDLDLDANPDPLPALCGGHTRIKGDLDGDDVPDITLDGAVFPVSSAAGLLVLSSHNTIRGLRIQHFPIGILVRTGDVTNLGTVTHTRMIHNILAESKLDGILVITGNAPGSLIAHTTITQNLVVQNARHGIDVVPNLSGAGSDTQITHTTITDNEVRGNKAFGIFMLSLGDHNVVSNATIAHNTVSGTTSFGINILGGFAGADGNTLDVAIKDNMVTDNGSVGIRVLAGQDNSSHNHVVAWIRGNTLEHSQLFGIATLAGEGAVNFPTGTNNNNCAGRQDCAQHSEESDWRRHRGRRRRCQPRWASGDGRRQQPSQGGRGAEQGRRQYSSEGH